MAIFKCKMCGGALEINNNETVATCEYCGTQQTLPKLDDDRKANLYDRANHFRRNNEFDKAMGIYEQILNEDNSDAESYWSLVLCRYGIEYVEDPSSHKRVPTVNRAQFTSVFDDEDYKSALKYADGFQKEVYEAEAKVINEIQKGILAISQQEEPFDVFICYKETDAGGRRTQDSVIATELYHELTREGYKVFFSRITLEDKLGTAYEPYIFAALNSSKVMVVLGTKPEYFNAVWVKNEWSRYLSLIKNGEKKILIPAYRDMDPYDLPEEFSHLQAQDMTKLGFMQDLIRGINKLVRTETPQTTVVKETVVTGGNANAESLLKRVFIFLDDKDWKSADEYCEKVLDIDPENACAYLGKLMAQLKVCKQDDLKNCEQPFDNKNNFKKAIRFSDKELAETLTGYVTFINDRNHTAKMNSLYAEAMKSKNAAKTKIDFDYAAEKFKAISDWKDAKEQYEECLKKAKEAAETAAYNEKLEKYNKACNGMDTHTVVLIEDRIGCVEKAKKTFATIIDFKDSEEKISKCNKLLDELYDEQKRLEAENQQKAEKTQKEAKKRKKLNKKILIIVLTVIVLGSALFAGIKILLNQKKEMQEIIDILTQTSGNIYLEDVLSGEGRYGENYVKFKERDGFIRAVNKTVKTLLESDQSYDSIIEKLRILESEDLINDDIKNLLNDFEISTAKEYGNNIVTALESREYDDVAKNLSWLLQRNLFETSGVDIDATVDTLLENCSVYSVKNNTGAYYDNIELKSSSSTQHVGAEGMESIGTIHKSYILKSYGDFCIGTSRRTSHYEALEEFEDLADKYNTTETSKTLYLRGKEVNGYFWFDTVERVCGKGADYIICYENELDDDEIDVDGILFLCNDRIYVMDKSQDKEIYIKSDFSDALKKAESLYCEKYSPDVEIAKGMEFFDKKQYEKAAEILKFYTHIEDVSKTVYTIAVEAIKASNEDYGLTLLKYIEGFESMNYLSMEHMIENLDKKFNPDVTSSENYYPLPFLRLMMDVKGSMSGDEIIAAFSDKDFSEIPSGIYNFNADGSGYKRQWEINWSVSDNKLIINENKADISVLYDVFNVLPGYYLLTYTPEGTATMKMILLKAQ